MTTLIIIATSFSAGALFGYLTLRNNPLVRAALDRAADQGEDILKR